MYLSLYIEKTIW